MSEQEIVLDENQLLNLINGKQIITRVGESKVIIRQSYVKPLTYPPVNQQFKIIESSPEMKRRFLKETNQILGGRIND